MESKSENSSRYLDQVRQDIARQDIVLGYMQESIEALQQYINDLNIKIIKLSNQVFRLNIYLIVLAIIIVIILFWIKPLLI